VAGHWLGAPSVPGTDPFPTERFTALIRRFPAYARLAWRLSRDGRISGRRRAVVLAAAAYLASPVDLVPGLIPVAGQLDDAAVALLGLRFALRGLPATDRATLLHDVGLAESDLDDDLGTVRAGAGWLLRRGGRIAFRAGRGVWHVASVGTRVASVRARHLLRRPRPG
jgi:uncharacterized membrane protein YkvA (DUF1232 family)